MKLAYFIELGDKLYVRLDRVPIRLVGANRMEMIYAEALNNAMERGILTEPGVYGVRFSLASRRDRYTVYKVADLADETPPIMRQTDDTEVSK
jgi:hypothetical protein